MSTAGTPSRRRTAALLVRLLIPGLLVMVLTESHAARKVNPMNVVFALDISDSNPDVDQGIAYVLKTVQSQRLATSNDRQTLVVFGKDSSVEIASSRVFPFEAIESDVGRGATNLERALAMSLAVIRQDEDGRIVLISDGNPTEGDVSRILPALMSRGVAVDVLPVEYSYDREVWLESLELPERVALGETYEATVVLSATVAGKGMLTLNEEGGRIARQSIDYQVGQNRFTLPFTVDRVGYHEYIASLDVSRFLDSRVQNNTVSNSLYLDGVRRVLLVHDDASYRESWGSFADAVWKTSGTLESTTSRSLPRDAQQLASYDVIVFGNVSRQEFDQKQLEAVRDAIDQRGVGFLMFGGANSFCPGGYHKSPIEELVPVSCDPSDALEKAAMVVVLDVIPAYDGAVRAKGLLSNLMKSLGTDDELGVIIRRKGDDVWLFPLTPVADKTELRPFIAGAQFDRVISFENTLQAALRELSTNNAKTRHVLIISDGSPRSPTTELLQRFQRAGITVSAAAIYPPGGQDHSSLSRITEITRGRYHFANHPDQLLSVIASEVNLLNRRALQQVTFDPTPGEGSTILNDFRGVPPLFGYVATSLKKEAIAPELVIPSAARSSGAPIPLLAFGQHGLGRTAAFTSNFDAKWGGFWQSWPGFPQFVDRLLSKLDRPKNLRITTRISDEIATVIVNDLHADDLPLPLETTVYGPDDKAESLHLVRVAPRRYEASIPLWGHGRYHIVTTLTARDRHESAFGAFGHVVTYSPELLQLSSRKQSLQEIAAAVGGRVLTGDPAKDAVYAQGGRTLKYIPQGSFDWMLILLALLVPTYAACQRLWHDAELAREQWNAPPLPSPTMQALFKKKEWVATALSAKGTARMLIQIWAPPPIRHASTPAASTPMTPQEAVSSADSSSTTIEKLLAMKRRQNEHS